MDAIRAAAKVFRNSSKMIKKKMVHAHCDHVDHHSTLISRNKYWQLLIMCVAPLSIELDDDWLHSQDPVESGVSFYVKVS